MEKELAQEGMDQYNDEIDEFIHPKVKVNQLKLPYSFILGTERQIW